MNRKQKIRFLPLLLAVLCAAAAALSGCAADKSDPRAVGAAFAQAIANGDYERAFDYAYLLTSDVRNKEEFVKRYTNIYKALDLKNAQLLQYSVEPSETDEGEYVLHYSIQFNSDLIGKTVYDFTAQMAQGPKGYSVLYTPSLILPMMQDGDKVRALTAAGARGEIFAADGSMLAKNDYAQSVYLDMEKDPDIGEIKTFLSDMLGADAEAVQAKYDKAAERNAPLEVLLTFPKHTLSEDEIAEISAVNGLGVDEKRLTPVRYYPLKDDAAHLLGYMGSPTPEMLTADPELSENASVGRAGLELALEETLRGTDGKIVYIEDERGSVKEILYEDEKTDGVNVQLTIDPELQERAYTLLAANLKDGYGGGALVMDYKTGEVKALVSYPSFDANLFNFALSAEVWDYYSNEDSGNPLINRITQSAFMPGSTFKPFTSAPAIQEGILAAGSVPPITKTEPHTEGNDSSSYCWTPSLEGWHSGAIFSKDVAQAPYDYEMAMKSSDNIYFAYYALQTPQENFRSYLTSIGVGEDPPPFELPVKKSSMISGDEDTIDWLDWRARTGYGTGQLVVSPLQLGVMYTAIENNGDMVNPTLIARTFAVDENDDETTLTQAETSYYRTGTMSPAVINTVKPALRRVMTDGTGYGALLGEKFNIYGKTGTAQVGENALKREVNWVIALNESDGLLYLVVVETAVDDGNAPKLATLRGLVDADSYSQALTTVFPDPNLGEEEAAEEE